MWVVVCWRCDFSFLFSSVYELIAYKFTDILDNKQRVLVYFTIQLYKSSPTLFWLVCLCVGLFVSMCVTEVYIFNGIQFSAPYCFHVSHEIAFVFVVHVQWLTQSFKQTLIFHSRGIVYIKKNNLTNYRYLIAFFHTIFEVFFRLCNVEIIALESNFNGLS